MRHHCGVSTLSRHSLFPLLSDELREVKNTLAVSPLVIVPSDNLDHVITHHHGEGRVDGGGNVGHSVIARHQGLIRDTEDAIHGAVSSLAESRIDLLSESLLLDLDDEIDNGDSGGGHTESNTVELALHVGKHKGNSLGSTSGGGDNVEGSSASTAKIAVRSIEETLVTSVRVGGGHGTLDNAELLIEHLYERSKAVGGARSVGDDLVGVDVLVSVDTNNVGGDIIALGRGSDQNLLGTGLKMLGGTLGVNENTGTLNHEIYIQSTPGELEGVAGRHNLDGLAVDGEAVISDNLNLGLEGTHGRVVLQEMGSLLNTSGVVDGNNLDVGVGTALPAAEELATNAAETVDGNLDLLDGNGHLAGTSTGLRKKREREEVLLELVDRCCWTKWC